MSMRGSGVDSSPCLSGSAKHAVRRRLSDRSEKPPEDIAWRLGSHEYSLFRFKKRGRVVKSGR